MLPDKKLRLSPEEKLAILNEYLNTSITKTAIQEKYELGHCTIDRWLKQFNLQGKDTDHHNTRRKKAERVRRIVEHARTMEQRLMETESALEAEKAANQELNALLNAASAALGRDLRKEFGG